MMGLWVEMFVAEGDALGVGIDETLQRRATGGRYLPRGGRPGHKVRSTHETFVKSSVRCGGCARCCWWRSLGPLEFGPCLSSAPWPLPSVMPPRAGQATQEMIAEWAWQLVLQIRRWYPEREIVVVADGAYASLKLLDRCRSLRVGRGDLHHPFAARCRPLRAGSSKTPRADREASPQGRAPAQPVGGGRRSHHDLEAHHDR